MSDDTEAITVLIEPVVRADGFDLDDVTVHRSGDRSVVRITVDHENGGELDRLADLSRAISTALDDADEPILGALRYTLEVTSPGVDRPLTLARHWRRAHGRKVAATVAGESITGRIGRLDEAGTTVDIVVTRSGRASVRAVTLDEVESAVVQVDFGGPTRDERELCGLDEGALMPVVVDLSDTAAPDHPTTSNSAATPNTPATQTHQPDTDDPGTAAPKGHA